MNDAPRFRRYGEWRRQGAEAGRHWVRGERPSVDAYRQLSALEPHRRSPRRGTRRDFRRRMRRWVVFSWVSPETVALAHGARVGYVWQGGWIERLDWDLVEWTVQHLLGYSPQVHGHNQPVLRDALQSVALMWPPLGFREAVHEVVWRWSCDRRLDATHRVERATRRLRRARGILEEWSR